MDLIIFPLLMVGMYMLLVRPQQKRLKAQRELIASIAVGDEVVTAGGIIGTVRVLTDDRIFLEVADGVELRVLRGAISRTIEPATATEAPRPASAPRDVADLPGQDVRAQDVDALDDDEQGTRAHGIDALGVDEQDVEWQDVDQQDVEQRDVEQRDVGRSDGPDTPGARGDR
jgi:preprotein translocase subunit YajC